MISRRRRSDDELTPGNGTLMGSSERKLFLVALGVFISLVVIFVIWYFIR
jgi:hypothetical protein